jgi:hypothetical protein
MPREWTWAPTNIPPKCKLSKWQKQSLQADADQFVAEFYRPAFIKPPPKDPRFNYIVDFSTKWRGPYLQFIARYACPGPNALSPFFEIAFARLGYFGPDFWSLWARRHNDQWIVFGSRLSLKECFEEMRTNPWFHC